MDRGRQRASSGVLWCPTCPMGNLPWALSRKLSKFFVNNFVTKKSQRLGIDSEDRGHQRASSGILDAHITQRERGWKRICNGICGCYGYLGEGSVAMVTKKNYLLIN